jgi:hypothetical protein
LCNVKVAQIEYIRYNWENKLKKSLYLGSLQPFPTDSKFTPSFINRVYYFQEIYDTIEEAIDKAVNSCIEDGILSELLIAHKAEVARMLLTEFNEEEYIDMVKAEGIEIGKSEGIEIGKKEIILELISNGTITPEQGAASLGISLDELNS